MLSIRIIEFWCVFLKVVDLEKVLLQKHRIKTLMLVSSTVSLLQVLSESEYVANSHNQQMSVKEPEIGESSSSSSSKSDRTQGQIIYKNI